MNVFSQMMFQVHSAMTKKAEDEQVVATGLALTPGRVQFRKVLLKKWRSAAQIADAIGLAISSTRGELARLEREQLVVRRVSKTKKNKNGHPTIEYTWEDPAIQNWRAN